MDRPDRKEELSPTSASGRTSSTEKNKPVKRKSLCLGEETTSPDVVKKRKCVSDGCVAHTYSGPEKNKPVKRKSLCLGEETTSPDVVKKRKCVSDGFVAHTYSGPEKNKPAKRKSLCLGEEEEEKSPDVVKKSLCSVGRSAAEHQVSVPGQQGDDKTREPIKRPAPDAECSSWPAKKQRRGPSGKEGKGESKDCWKLPDRRRPAGEKQQQFSAEERHAVSLLQEAGVPLLDERQVALLSSKAHETLGAGAFGSCCKVWDPHSGEELVIKTYHSGSVGDLVKEASILQRLQVVAGVQRLVGACVKRRWLVTRYAGLTVERYFVTGPSLPDLLSVVLQVARTLQELAREGYAHNDIKGDNLCVREGSRGPEATVIDLGVAERLDMRQINRNEEPEPFSSWLVPRLPLGVPPWIKDIDKHDLASTIHHALAMHGGLSSAPCLSPIRAWVNAVIRPGPGERPTLQALIQMLEALLEALRGGQTQGRAAVTLPPGGGGLTEQRAANTPLQGGGVHAQGRAAGTPRLNGYGLNQQRAAGTPRLNGCGLNQQRAAGTPRPYSGSRRRATKEEGSEKDEGSEYH